jgi:hypothetical protein
MSHHKIREAMAQLDNEFKAMAPSLPTKSLLIERLEHMLAMAHRLPGDDVTAKPHVATAPAAPAKSADISTAAPQEVANKQADAQEGVPTTGVVADAGAVPVADPQPQGTSASAT